MAKKKGGDRPLRVSEDKKFQMDEDLRTIRRAEEIRTDSRRMRGVRKLAKTEVQALKKIGKGRK